MSCPVPELPVARCRCMFSQLRKQVFSREAVDLLPVVMGLRVLETIQLRSSDRRSQASLSEGTVVGVWPEDLPGPLSLCRLLERYGTCGVELVPPELSYLGAVLPGPLRLAWCSQPCLRKRNFASHKWHICIWVLCFDGTRTVGWKELSPHLCCLQAGVSESLLWKQVLMMELVRGVDVRGVFLVIFLAVSSG